jgi:hypothetical protein
MLNAYAKNGVTVICNAGKSNMEILVKQGQKIERYKSNGQAGQGEGAKAGTAYRLKDGSIIYLPEDESNK